MENDKVEVWIASVCLTPLSVIFLREAIFSALNCTNVIVKVSMYTKEDISILLELKKNNRERLHIQKHKEPLSQFDNLAYLASILSLKDNDWVVFLDDDDLLLTDIKSKLNPSINGFVGWQYIGVTKNNVLIPGNEKVTFENVKEFISSNPDILQADDFSGTSLRFKYVKEYFTNHRCSKITRMLEDIAFMNFVEHQVPNVKSYKKTEPFIFHRIKETPSIWREQVLNTLNELNTISKGIDKKSQELDKKSKEIDLRSNLALALCNLDP
jgi:hypothetical protein